MGSARYVGRVGALAVALGIGVAVGTTPGVAWSSPGSSTSPDSNVAGDDAPAAPDTEPSGAGNAEGAAGAKGVDDVEETATRPDRNTEPRNTKARDRTTTGVDSPDGDTDSDTAVVDVPEEAPESLTSSPATRTSKANVGSSAGAGTRTGQRHDDTPEQAATPDVPTGAEAAPNPAHEAAPLRVPVADTTAQTIATQPGLSTLDLPAPAPPATPDPLETLLAIPAMFISAGVDSFVNFFSTIVGPGAPFDNPVLWGLLEATRRETNRIWANRTPILNLQTTGEQDLDDREIHGTLGASDPDGDALSYRVSTLPTMGTVSINAAAGTWTYTPDTDYSGDDTFTITASDDAAGWHIHGLGQTHSGTDTITVVSNTPSVVDPENPYTIEPPLPGDEESGIVRGQINVTDTEATLEYTPTIDPDLGTVDIDADGTWTFIPTARARVLAYLSSLNDAPLRVFGRSVDAGLRASSTAGADALAQADSPTNGREANFIVTVTDSEGQSVEVPVVATIVATQTAPIAYPDGWGAFSDIVLAPDGTLYQKVYNPAVGTLAVAVLGPTSSTFTLVDLPGAEPGGTLDLVVGPDGTAYNTDQVVNADTGLAETKVTMIPSAGGTVTSVVIAGISQGAISVGPNGDAYLALTVPNSPPQLWSLDAASGTATAVALPGALYGPVIFDPSDGTGYQIQTLGNQTVVSRIDPVTGIVTTSPAVVGVAVGFPNRSLANDITVATNGTVYHLVRGAIDPDSGDSTYALAVMDAVNGTATTTPLPGRPEAIVTAPNGNLYVQTEINDSETTQGWSILVLDPTGAIVETIALVGAGPSLLKIGPDGTGALSITQRDATTNQNVSVAVLLDTVTNLTDSFTLPGYPFPIPPLVGPDGTAYFVNIADTFVVSVIDPVNGVVATVSLGDQAQLSGFPAFGADGSAIFTSEVRNYAVTPPVSSTTIRIIDPTTGAVSLIPLSGAALGGAVAGPDGIAYQTIRTFDVNPAPYGESTLWLIATPPAATTTL